MTKVIKLISLFVYTGTDDNIRINTVYDLLNPINDIELITTDFNHRTKSKHSINNSDRNIRMLKVPSYKRNLSFKRFYSHGIFAYRLYRYLISLPQKPDVVYCIVPTISSGLVCALYCKKNRIKLAVDVIDIWPESFIALFPLKKIITFFTYFWKLLANYVYSSADLLFAESVEYAKIAQKNNNKTTALPVYLGTNIEKYRMLVSQSNLILKKPKDEIWICYGGGLENSYDFDVILNAFNELVKSYNFRLKFFFIGDGIKANEIKLYIDKFNLPAIITGFLSYGDFLKYLSTCDIALNSFKKDSKVAHSYKFNDYIVAGLAIVNNLEGETASFIEKYNIGLNFNYTNNKLIDILVRLIENPNEIDIMKANSTYVANNILNSKIIYKEMISQIEN